MAANQVFNFVRLSAPAATEIKQLQDYFRIRHSKSIEWNAQAEKMPIWIAAENRPLDYWYDQFQEAGEITLATARQLNWLSGTVGEQPALERLEKMVGLPSVKEAVRRRMRSLEVQLARIRQ